jgi:hypothetical protein
MNKVLKVLVLLPAILFMVTGIRWLVAPAEIAPNFGLALAMHQTGTCRTHSYNGRAHPS